MNECSIIGCMHPGEFEIIVNQQPIDYWKERATLYAWYCRDHMVERLDELSERIKKGGTA